MAEQDVEILLVEDTETDIELTLHTLREHKLADRIHVVRDGAEALDFLYGTSDAPRLILLDLKLPKVDGLEVLESIRSDTRLSTVPVVVLTSSHEERDLVESYRLGVNSYLVKPVGFDQFSRTVKDLGLYWLLLNRLPSRQKEG